MRLNESDPTDFEIKMDEKGNLIINPYEYLQNLSEEQKKDFLSDGGWWCLVEKEMVEEIINGFGTEGYNETYHKLRSMLLNCDAMPDVIRRWARDMIELRLKSKQYEQYWEQAYYNLYHWIKDTSAYEDNELWRTFPRLPDHKYGVEIPKDIMEDVYAKAKEWGLLFPEQVKEDEE
jgi:hypothetical protein